MSRNENAILPKNSGSCDQGSHDLSSHYQRIKQEGAKLLEDRTQATDPLITELYLRVAWAAHAAVALLEAVKPEGTPRDTVGESENRRGAPASGRPATPAAATAAAAAGARAAPGDRKLTLQTTARTEPAVIGLFCEASRVRLGLHNLQRRCGRRLILKDLIAAGPGRIPWLRDFYGLSAVVYGALQNSGTMPNSSPPSDKAKVDAWCDALIRALESCRPPQPLAWYAQNFHHLLPEMQRVLASPSLLDLPRQPSNPVEREILLALWAAGEKSGDRLERLTTSELLNRMGHSAQGSGLTRHLRALCRAGLLGNDYHGASRRPGYFLTDSGRHVARDIAQTQSKVKRHTPPRRRT